MSRRRLRRDCGGVRRVCYGDNTGLGSGDGRHRRDEAVAATRNRFHVARRRGVVTERRPNLAHTVVQTQIEIDKGVIVTPKLLLDFLASDHFAGIFKEEKQKLQSLRLKSDGRAELRQFSPVEVYAKNTERHYLGAAHAGSALCFRLEEG